jgi:hypothetical protein
MSKRLEYTHRVWSEQIRLKLRARVESGYQWTGGGFLRCTGKGLRFDDAGVSLRRGVTVADELGKCNDRDREEISGLRIARKTFNLDRLITGSPGENDESAKLCPYLECDRAGGQLEISVNGHTIIHTWEEDRPYWTDRWVPIAVPVAWLRLGDNDVLFRSLDDSIWSLLIESSRQPDRSSVSEDGGQTWRSEELGWNNGCDGEYMVRLWLDQYCESVTVESEVIDLFRDASRDLAVEEPDLSVKWQFEAEGLPSREMVFKARAGSTPTYDPKVWSAWQDTGELVIRPDDRFAQWQVTLVSDDPARSPLLKSVSVDTGICPTAGSCVVYRSEQGLRKSSYRFSSTQHDEPRSDRLRDRWHLDDVVRGTKSEWDTYLSLRQWVRNQWEDGWDMGEIDFCPPWDAMMILELASRNLSLGMCTHYATVMSQCCAALGLIARTQIVRSHCINEVWSTEHRKWVAMDIGGDSDDETKFVYHFERNGVPLSSGECHEAWTTQSYDDVRISPQPPAATGDRYDVEKRLKLFERFMISLRTDEIRSLEPGESEHGRGSYHYDGYLFWEDAHTGALPWFSHHTSRRDDLYWSVNETYIHLREGREPGQLNVLLESPAPNLAGYERSFDGISWSKIEPAFVWAPEKDGSRMHVRSMNYQGHHGVASIVEVGEDD